MQFIHPDWVDIFNYNQLGRFEDIWQLQLPYVDEGNYARGGYSVVSQHTLMLPNGQKETIYIKRQENYRCFDWRNPFSGMPTIEREFNNWKRFQRLGLPTYEMLFCEKRMENGQLQALLISRELPATDLSTFIKEIKEPGYKSTPATFQKRKMITHCAASVLRAIHGHKLRHGHMIPKHIFIGGLSESPQGYVIDLEILRKSPFRRPVVLHDIGRLARHLGGGSRTDKMRFFKSYLQIDRLSERNKKLWRDLHAQATKP